MIKRFLTVPFLLLALAPLGLWATASVVEPSTLAPKQDQVRATRIITGLMTKHHYRKTPLDDELSSAVFDRYLKNLDPNRNFLLADDVDALSVHRHRLDDALREGRLEPAFAIFRVFRARMEDRARYADSLIGHDFDFERDEEFVFDRSEAAWPKGEAELDEIWRKRVKNDVLTLRLSGKDDKEIAETLRKRYGRLGRRVGQLNADDVYQIFVNAYTASVEPHTAYLSPRTSENFRIRMSLSLEGIGAVLQSDSEHTVVRRLIPGGPAAKSGQLHVEDRITGVGQGADGAVVDVVSWRLEDVVELIRGPKDSVVRLELLPKGTAPTGARKVITLIRNRIELEEQAAKQSVLEVPGSAGGVTRIGVIDIPTFYRDVSAHARGEKDYRSTTRDVRRLLAELKEERVDGVVIDLRGDGGGSLTESIELTGLFIESGPIVQVKDSRGRVEVYEDPDPEITYSGPLAVLVDRHSASASEIFAGAIQDYGRGVVLGEPTFGKGTVQSLMDLARFADGRSGDLGQLKLTIAQFFRVTGASTQHRGVVPDILFPTAADSGDQGERALDNALPWAKARPARFEPEVGFALESLGRIRSNHRERTGSDPAFRVLLEEVQAQREAGEQVSTTLVESRRRAEQDAEEKAQREREAAFRIARGLPPLEEEEARSEDENEDGKAEEEQDDADDVWLEEAARILADLISVVPRNPATLKTAQEGGAERPCGFLGC